MTPEQRRRAGRAVAERMREMNATLAAVARAAEITPGTLRGLISGTTWPRDSVQDRIERVLRWQPGELVTRSALDSPNRALALLSDSQLSAELTRRLVARDRREGRLRSTDGRGAVNPIEHSGQSN